MSEKKSTRETWQAHLGSNARLLSNAPLQKKTIFGNFERISEVEGRFNSPYLYWGASKRPISIATGLPERLQRQKKTDAKEQTFS